ncbi:MAG: T9SS type A sorting domain-containing protein [Bacteroidales bacterium]|nr:T9SS type A sorting domain-containing protein [Bacteroidales bacterium]
MKKLTFFKSLIAAIMMAISLSLSAQNTLEGTCPGYCDPSGGGAVATATDAFYMTINTETNGDVTFSILGVPNNTTTVFRNNGWADGIITAITVNGDANAANKYFTRTISSDKKVVTLVKQSEIPANATIIINGILEYKTADTGDESNLWPTVNISFQYGTTCNFVQTPLATPTITNIDADKKITFTNVPNAASYKVYVYRDDALVHSQEVVSGDVINFTPTVTYDYTVKLQAISNDINYTNSAYSEGYTWPLTAEGVELGPSKFCDYVIGSNADDYAYLSWETDANGNVVITISGYAGDTNTSFRSAGLGGDLSKFTVNGNPASNYFTRTYAGDGSTTYTLTLISGASILPGDKISYTGGTVEWKTSKNTNAYKTYTFTDYVYGTDCSSLPTVTTDPSSISFSPTVGSQTFTITGTNLTGAITITPPRGLTVNPSIISPDENGEINQTVTVNWTSGTTSGSTLQISGGGLVSNVAVLVNTSGFSDYCNKVIYQQNSTNYPAYMTIDMSSDKTQMVFSIAPYNEGDGTIWNRIFKIVVNGGTANALVASNVLSADKTQITITFTQPLQVGDQVTFGGPMVWETNANHNIFIDALQGPYVVGQTCSLEGGPVSSSTNILDKSITIYPNPASESIYFSNKVAEANLFTLQGQKVLSVQNSMSLNISNLRKGLYIVKLIDLSGNQQTSKIEVQ